MNSIVVAVGTEVDSPKKEIVIICMELQPFFYNLLRTHTLGYSGKWLQEQESYSVDTIYHIRQNDPCCESTGRVDHTCYSLDAVLLKKKVLVTQTVLVVVSRCKNYLVE